MTPLIKRLAAAQRDARFTKADVARWLRLPWVTVNAWLNGTNDPMEYNATLIEERLGWLEKELATGDFFPVPPDTAFRDRPQYVLARLAVYEQRWQKSRSRRR